MASATVQVNYDIDTTYLSEDQVNYELKLRGFVSKVGIEIQRKSLRRLLLQDIANQSIYKLGKEADIENEKQDIALGLEEVQNLTTQVDVNFRAVKSKLSHLIGRLSRLPLTGENGEFRIDNLMVALALEEEVEEFNNNPELCRRDNVRNERVPSQNLSVAANTNLLRGIPVCQWNLFFSGGLEGLSLPNFLERVEELRIARNVSTTELFNSAVDLFTGSALIWYRSVRESAKSWDTLVQLLKRDFLSPDYDSELWLQIRERKQRPKERIAIYVAVMKNLFSKLGSIPSEGEQLSIVRKNILPEIRAHLALVDIKSLEQLTALCTTLEQTIFPTLYQVRQKSSIAASVDVDFEANNKVAEISNNRGSPESRSKVRLNVCWNCEKIGHMWRNCNRTRGRFCFKCGTKDVVVTTCPACNPRPNLN